MLIFSQHLYLMYHMCILTSFSSFLVSTHIYNQPWVIFVAFVIMIILSNKNVSNVKRVLIVRYFVQCVVLCYLCFNTTYPEYLLAPQVIILTPIQTNVISNKQVLYQQYNLSFLNLSFFPLFKLHKCINSVVHITFIKLFINLFNIKCLLLIQCIPFKVKVESLPVKLLTFRSSSSHTVQYIFNLSFYVQLLFQPAFFTTGPNVKHVRTTQIQNPYL